MTVMNQSHDIESNPVSPVFQVFLMIISASCISLIYLYRLGHFSTADVIRSPKPIPIEIQANFPKKITVGLYLQNYETFSIINNDFICNAHLWFTCDPGIVSLDTIDKFEFENGNLLYRSTPYVTLTDNQLVVIYEIRLQFSTPLTYERFPFDEHRLTISFANKRLAPQEAILEVSDRNFIVKALASSFGWHLADTFTQAGYQTVSLDTYDSRKTLSYVNANFYLDYAHHSARLIMSIVLPQLLIFYLSLLALSMRGPYQSTAAVAALTGIITYRFVIDNLSPKVGYFMISDYLFITFLLGAFCSLVMAFLDTFGFETTVRLKKILIGSLHIAIILINIYLTA